MISHQQTEIKFIAHRKNHIQKDVYLIRRQAIESIAKKAVKKQVTIEIEIIQIHKSIEVSIKLLFQLKTFFFLHLEHKFWFRYQIYFIQILFIVLKYTMHQCFVTALESAFKRQFYVINACYSTNWIAVVSLKSHSERRNKLFETNGYAVN